MCYMHEDITFLWKSPSHSTQKLSGNSVNQAVHQAGGNAGLPLQRGVTAQLYFETTEADVNFTKDEEMAGKHHVATESQVIIPQLFRIWSTNPVNISTLLTLTSPRIYRWWGEGEEEKLGELTEDVGRGWRVGDTRARDMLEGNEQHTESACQKTAPRWSLKPHNRMEAFRRNWSGQWLTQLCRWQRRQQIRTQMWWVEGETMAVHQKQKPLYLEVTCCCC